MTLSSLVQSFYQFLTHCEENRLSCGAILARCKNFSKELLDTMRFDLEKERPTVVAQYVFDASKGILGVIVEGQKLSDTHFHCLLVKDYLLQRNLLGGSLLVASFPESAETASEMLIRMIQEIKEPGVLGAIKIYDHRIEERQEEAASILLINNDETVTEFLRIYLQRKGYQVHVACDGMDGVNKYQEVTPDLVITDLNLPIMNGYQIMERIRNEAKQASKIVVLTDKRLEEDVSKSFAMGASDYITKPFSPTELEARVKRLIS
ncbi:response regulator transcription factor [Brevibacillus fluminis]|uniref:response regulator transcription factor n=1 Tax=Brevibacillus fluminis TaxID=511487 RepID=UPI001FEBA6A5|nr:response regulator transcription factor [Brevibacillus fluminis]